MDSNQLLLMQSAQDILVPVQNIPAKEEEKSHQHRPGNNKNK